MSPGKLFDRAIVVVLDSVGAGALPDAARFGDTGASTLGHIRDAVGLSMLSGAHLALAPPVVAGLRAAGLDTPVVVGGIVPEQDLPVLAQAGVAEVIGPGATSDEVVAALDRAIAAAGS